MPVSESTLLAVGGHHFENRICPGQHSGAEYHPAGDIDEGLGCRRFGVNIRDYYLGGSDPINDYKLSYLFEDFPIGHFRTDKLVEGAPTLTEEAAYWYGTYKNGITLTEDAIIVKDVVHPYTVYSYSCDDATGAYVIRFRYTEIVDLYPEGEYSLICLSYNAFYIDTRESIRHYLYSALQDAGLSNEQYRLTVSSDNYVGDKQHLGVESSLPVSNDTSDVPKQSQGESTENSSQLPQSSAGGAEQFPPTLPPVDPNDPNADILSDHLGLYVNENGCCLSMGVASQNGLYYGTIYNNRADAQNYVNPLIEFSMGSMDDYSGPLHFTFEDAAGNLLYLERDSAITGYYTLFLYGPPYFNGVDMSPFYGTTFYMVEQGIDVMY